MHHYISSIFLYRMHGPAFIRISEFHPLYDIHPLRHNRAKSLTPGHISLPGLQVSVVGLERALNAYVKEVPDTPFDIKTVPLATASMQEQMSKPKPSM